MATDKQIEALAEYAHEAWSGWMKYLFDQGEADKDGGVRLPRRSVDWWKRQMNTDYAKLSEEEKDSDRKEADRMIAIFEATDGD